MSDSNTNLVQQALTIGKSLALAMGPNCKQHIRALLPGFLQALSVNKVILNTIISMFYKNITLGEKIALDFDTNQSHLNVIFSFDTKVYISDS